MTRARKLPKSPKRDPRLRLVRVGTRGTIYDVHFKSRLWGWVICTASKEWYHPLETFPFVSRSDAISDLLDRGPVQINGA